MKPLSGREAQIRREQFERFAAEVDRAAFEAYKTEMAKAVDKAGSALLASLPDWTKGE